ncbi:amino acid ABC transporter substrate-binding protein [Wenyingzhuangia sp. IMCC45574]
MKVFKLLYLLCFLVSTSIFAQQVKEYKTEKKESLKKIAKKFNVDYDKLVALNPDLGKKVKKNTVVRIPIATPKVKVPRNLQPIDFRPDSRDDLVSVPPKKELTTHKVAAKETLYGLSKKYGISMATLIQMNPILAKEGLKIGQELKVPGVKTQKANTVVEKKIIVNKIHQVKHQETLYGISRLYSVTVEAIKKSNPSVAANGLKEGESIVIPVQEKIVTQDSLGYGTPRQALGLNKNIHVVAKGETLYGIAKEHGFAISELLRVNSSVVIDSIDVGTVLNLPFKPEEINFVESDISPIYKSSPVTFSYNPKRDSIFQVLESFNISMDSLSSINPSLDSVLFYGGDLLIGFDKKFYLFNEGEELKDSIITDKPLSVMLMLPFQFKKNDTLSESQLFSRSNSLPSIVSDFYLGAEMAIDSLERQGVQIKLDVVDTQKSVDSLHAKIDAIRALEPDVIVGPLYSGNAMYVATNFPSTPVYYPVYSKKQSSFTDYNLIKTAASKAVLKEEMLSFIKEHRKDEHLIIIGENLSALKRYKKTLAKQDSIGEVLEDNISVLALSRGYFRQEDLIDKVKPNQTNWVLIAGDNNVITNDVFGIVKGLSKDKDLQSTFRILSFERLSFVDKLSYLELAKQKYTYATDLIEYESLLNKSFEESFKERNNAYPSNYALRGFAVTYDAIIRVLNNTQNASAGASQRFNHAFYYYKNGFPSSGNQAVFINTVENTEENGLRVVRLK